MPKMQGIVNKGDWTVRKRRENGESSPTHMLTEEIRQLRKGPGVTYKKLESSPALLDALNRSARVKAGSPTLELSLSDAYGHFLDEVRRVAPAAAAAALRNALGLEQPDSEPGAESPRNLTQRRTRFSERSGWHPDTLENRENDAIDELVRRLLAYGRPVDPAQAPTPPNEPFEHLSSEYLYVFGPGGTVKEIVVTREILSNTDGLRSYSATHSYLADPSPGVVQIERCANCEIDAVEYPRRGLDPGQMRATIRLPWLRAGQRHRFMYKLTIDSPEPLEPLIVTTPKGSAQQVVYRLQFQPEETPDTIWSFERIDHREAPGEADTTNRLQANELGYVEQTFLNLERGLAYGLAWKFATKLSGSNDAKVDEL